WGRPRTSIMRGLRFSSSWSYATQQSFSTRSNTAISRSEMCERGGPNAQQLRKYPSFYPSNDFAGGGGVKRGGGGGPSGQRAGGSKLARTTLRQQSRSHGASNASLSF